MRVAMVFLLPYLEDNGQEQSPYKPNKGVYIGFLMAISDLNSNLDSTWVLIN